MDTLKPLDAIFVDAEDEDKNTSMAIASIAVFQGPAPAVTEEEEPLRPAPQGRYPLR